MLKIGVVDFLNAYPLWAALENKSGIELIRGVPSFLATELFAGRVDAALISSVEHLRHGQGYAFHPALCIAAGHEVRSIRLFVKKRMVGFNQQLSGMNKIYTDIASRSSVAQLQLILRELKKEIVLEEVTDVQSKLAALGGDESLLTIGDTALKNIERPSYDLQREYNGIFGRGFVYALWVYRDALAKELVPILSEAYAEYTRDQSAWLFKATERFGFGADFTRDYLTNVIQHELTPERKADLDFFATRLHV